MSDAPSSDPSRPPAGSPGSLPEVEVDLAAFLPEGVELGEETEAADIPADGAGADVGTASGTEGPADDGQDPSGAPAAEEERPAVDLEALSQIERDLDAVDAAIAALDAGTYGIDPATGQPVDDALLAEDPTRLS